MRALILVLAFSCGPASYAAPVHAQVPLEQSLREVTLDGRTVLLARFPVRNPTASFWHVEVGKVYEQIPDDTTVVLGPEVAAQPSPRRFTLEPGAVQLVAVMIEAGHARTGFYRLEVTVRDGDERMTGAQGGVRAAILMATRYLVKLGTGKR